MKSIRAVLLAATLGPQSALADDGGGIGTHGGFVADPAAAVGIAEATLAAAHGKFLMEVQRPYVAYSRDDVWVVKGTFGNLHPNFAFTHPYLVEISKSGGRILRAGTE